MCDKGSSLPESPQILDALWRALDLELPRSRKPNGRRFLRGERPLSDAARAALLRAMVRVSIEAGYIPVAKSDWFDPVELLASAVEVWISEWDHLVGLVRGLEREDADRRIRYLRIASLDLAIRCAAFDELFDCPPPPLALDDRAASTPIWSCEDGVLNQLLKLPNALGVPRNKIHAGKTKDDWFGGRSRPLPENVSLFAASLASHDKSKAPTRRWLLYLNWLFALSDICDEVARIFDRGTAIEMATMFRRVRTEARHAISSVSSTHRDAVLADLVLFGGRASCGRGLIDALVRQEVGEHYGVAMDLRAAGSNWFFAELSSFMSREPEVPVGIPAELGFRLIALVAGGEVRELVNAARTHPAALLWLIRTIVQQAVLRGDFETVASVVGNIADTTDVADHQLEASLAYTIAGNRDEAARRLQRLSAEAATPAAVSAIATVHTLSGGRYTDAVSRLESMEPRPPVLDFVYGLALVGVGRVVDALAMFQRIIDRVPGHGLAIQQAARCCDMLGRTVDANRYARRASRLGRARVAAKQPRVSPPQRNR